MRASSSTAWEILLVPPPPAMALPDLVAVLLVVDASGPVRTLSPLGEISPNAVKEVLERATRENAPSGAAGWPDEARIQATTGAEVLRAVLEAAGVRVREDAELPAAQAALSALDEIAARAAPGTALGAVGREEELCEAIARLARQRPWELIDSDTFLSLSFEPPLPPPFARPVASVLGGLGELFGVMFYEDEEAADALLDTSIALQARMAEAEAGLEEAEAFEGALRGIQLVLEPEDEMPCSIVKAWDARGWPRPKGFVPTLARHEGGPSRPLSSPEELAAALAMLEALAAFFEAWRAGAAGLESAPFQTEVQGRRATVSIEDEPPELPWVDRESDLLTGAYRIMLGRPEADAVDLLTRPDVDFGASPGLLLLQTTKDEGQRVAQALRAMAAPKLCFASCLDPDGVPAISIWVVEGDGEDAAVELLGLLRDASDPALLPLLGPLAPGEERRLPLLVVGGGVRRRLVKAKDLVLLEMLDVVPPPPALEEELRWEDEDDAERIDAILNALGHAYGAFGWPPPSEAIPPQSQAPSAGRNDPCPCSSGKKYKKCCLGKTTGPSPARRAFALHALDRRLVRKVLDDVGAHEPDALEDAAAALPPGLGADPTYVDFMGPLVAYVGAPQQATPARRFLDRKGGRLDAEERGWLEAQLAAPLSLWRVVDVVPGESLRLEDVFTGETRKVLERAASESLPREAVLLARVVDHDGLSLLAGIHPLVLEPSRAALVEDAVREMVEKVPGIAFDDFRHGPLRMLLVERWHDVASAQAEPRLENTDGEPLLFTKDRFAIPEGRANDVRAALLALEGAQAQGPDEIVFLRPEPKRSGREFTVLGHARLGKDRLLLETLSTSRADALRARVEDACGGLLRFLARTHEDPFARLEEARASLERAAEKAPLSPTEHAVSRALTRRLRLAWMDEPVPALDGMTPRQAAKDPGARKKLERLLRDQEMRAATAEDREDVAMLRRELLGEGD